jgi:nucleoside-diphosphate-sugar epimerase
VVNLAYPTSGPATEHQAQTEALFRTIGALIRDGGHLIHVSTLAVFGSALDRRVDVGPVQPSRDVPYVEAKIAAEKHATKLHGARELSVDIVRLGNVVGPASATWAVPFVHRLISGRPIGVAGVPGFSNSTDVANVASYLQLLLQVGGGEPGVRYHHVAEFSRAPWSDWIAPLAAAMRVDPVYAERRAVQTRTARDELLVALRPFKPRYVYRTLSRERVLGSWMRTLKRRVLARAFPPRKHGDAIFAQQPTLDRAEETFLAIMSARQEFECVVRPEWTPAVTKQQSIDRVLLWLSRDWDLELASE